MIRIKLYVLVCALQLLTLTGCSSKKENALIVPDAAQSERIESYAKQADNQFKDRAAGTANRQ